MLNAVENINKFPGSHSSPTRLDVLVLMIGCKVHNYGLLMIVFWHGPHLCFFLFQAKNKTIIRKNALRENALALSLPATFSHSMEFFFT